MGIADWFGTQSTIVTRQEFDALIRDELAPKLRSLGYAGSGRTFRRLLPDSFFTWVVNIQSNRWNAAYTGEQYMYFVNLGIVVDAEAARSAGQVAKLKRVSEPESAFRTRLDPPDRDLDWKATTETVTKQQLATIAVRIGSGDGLAWFERASSWDAYQNVTREDLEQFAQTPVPESVQWLWERFGHFTPTALVLVIARFHYQQGYLPEARRWASWALDFYRPFLRPNVHPVPALKQLAAGKLA